MLRLFEQLDRIRDVDLPVWIVGETGTGKELVARAIHQSGVRQRGPFYALHCASLPEELFESELFGYEAGAFTGAEEDRPGLLEHLRGGTLLLDEITELPLSTQKKLLQVIDSKMVRPLGSLEVRQVDVRFLAATNADVDQALREGALRDDLFYRLGAVEIRVPPLRERPEDISLLARHFLELHGRRLERPATTLSPESLAVLSRHDWPGNVRELETLAIRLLVNTSPRGIIGPQEVLKFLSPRRSSRLFPDEIFEGRDIKDLRRELERVYLERLFFECGGEVAGMLRKLGVKRSNLYTWMRKVGLDVAELRERL